MNFPVQKTDAEWRTLLADKDAEPVAFEVTRKAATERPFTGKYEGHWQPGHYLSLIHISEPTRPY